MVCGVRYVMTCGMLEMLKWCANNSIIMDVSATSFTNFANLYSGQCILNPASYPLLSHDGFDTPPPIHLDDVHCDGTENMLTECSHRGIGVHDCVAQTSEAGVICTSMFYISYSL